MKVGWVLDEEKTVSITVKAPAVLPAPAKVFKINSILAPSEVTAGETAEISVTFTNITTNYSSKALVQLYCDTTLLGSQEVGPISPGKSGAAKFSVTFPSAGTYTLKATISHWVEETAAAF